MKISSHFFSFLSRVYSCMFWNRGRDESLYLPMVIGLLQLFIFLFFMCSFFSLLLCFYCFPSCSFPISKNIFLRDSGLCGKCGNTLNLVDIAFLVLVAAKNWSKVYQSLLDYTNMKVRNEAIACFWQKLWSGQTSAPLQSSGVFSSCPPTPPPGNCSDFSECNELDALL